MSGNPNRFDGAGAEDRSDRTDLLRLLKQARTVIIQLVVLVQHIHRYPEESVARSLKRQRVEVSSGPSRAASSEPSAASSGASGADVVDELKSLWDFFMNMPDDYVLTPPADPPTVACDEQASGAGDGNEGEASVSAPCGSAPQLPHSIDEVVPQSTIVAQEQENEELESEEFEEHPCLGFISAPRVHKSE